MTYTVVVLEVRGETHSEIGQKLRDAGYAHAFLEDGLIDMTHIGLKSLGTRREPYSGNRELMDICMDETKADAEAIVELCDEAAGLEVNDVRRWTVFRHIEAIAGRAREIVRKMT